MFQRVLIGVVLSSLVACTGRGAIAGGAATAITGGFLVAKGTGNEYCPNGGTLCEIGEEAWAKPIDRTLQVTGIAMLIVGAGLVLYGLHETRDAGPAPVHAAPAVQPPSVIVTSGPPGGLDRLPAEHAIRAQLPNQLAIQISSAARRGDCAAALATGDRLATLDPALHDRVILEDASYAYCRDHRM